MVLRPHHFDGGVNVGSGYIALFTAKQADWTNEPGNNWNDKEIMTKGGSNIWACKIGNRKQFGDFDTFRDKVLNAYLDVSGVGSLSQLHCRFDSPDGPVLELFYDDRIAYFNYEYAPLGGLNFARF